MADEFDDFGDDFEDGGDFRSPAYAMPKAAVAVPNTQPMPNKQLRFSGVELEAENIDPILEVSAASVVAEPAAIESALAADVEVAVPVAAAAPAEDMDEIEQDSAEAGVSSDVGLLGSQTLEAGSSKAGDTAYIKSYLRIRPLNVAETAEGAPETMTIQDRSTVLLKAPVGSHAHANALGTKEHVVSYSGVYDKATGQRAMFEATVEPMVTRAMQDGTNGLVFAYGMTNAGKTYTISGKGGPESETAGILPRALDRVFDHVTAHNASAGHSGPHLVVSVTYVEIYNEATYDLLRGAEPASAGAGGAAKRPVAGFAGTLRGGPSTAVAGKGTEDARPSLEVATAGPSHVKGAKQWLVSSKKGAEVVLRHGASNKTHAETALNSESSRSHAIFTISVYKRDAAIAGPIPDRADPIALDIIMGHGYAAGYTPFTRMYIVDLAGSESQKRTGASGAALKEAGNINKSLMFLTMVLKGLKDAADGKTVAQNNYRSSQLTLLLRDCLQGSSAGDIAMIVCAGPGAKDYDETRKAVEWGALMKETRVVRAKQLSKWTAADGVDANGRRIVKGAAAAAAAAKAGAAPSLLRGDSASSGLTSTSTSGLGSTAGSLAAQVGAGSKRPRSGTCETDVDVTSALTELRAENDKLRAEVEIARADSAAAVAAHAREEASLADARAGNAEMAAELDRVSELLQGALGAAKEAQEAQFELAETTATLEAECGRLHDELADKEEAVEAEVRGAMVLELEARLAEKDAGWKARLDKSAAEMAGKLAKLLALQDVRAGAGAEVVGKGGKSKGSKGGKAVPSGPGGASATLAALMLEVGLSLHAPVQEQEEEGASRMQKGTAHAGGRKTALGVRSLGRGRSTLGGASTTRGTDDVEEEIDGESEGELEAARAALTETEAALIEAEDEVGRSQAREAELKARLGAAGATANELRAGLAEALGRAGASQAQVKELEKALKEAQAALACAQQSIEASALELASLKSHAADVSRIVQDRTEQMAAAQETARTAQNKAAASEAAFADNAASIDSYRSQIVGLNERLASLRASLEPMAARETQALAKAKEAEAEAEAARSEAAALRDGGAVPMVPHSYLLDSQAQVSVLSTALGATEVELQCSRAALAKAENAAREAAAAAAAASAQKEAWIARLSMELDAAKKSQPQSQVQAQVGRLLTSGVNVSAETHSVKLRKAAPIGISAMMRLGKSAGVGCLTAPAAPAVACVEGEGQDADLQAVLAESILDTDPTAERAAPSASPDVLSLSSPEQVRAFSSFLAQSKACKPGASNVAVPAPSAAQPPLVEEEEDMISPVAAAKIKAAAKGTAGGRGRAGSKRGRSRSSAAAGRVRNGLVQEENDESMGADARAPVDPPTAQPASKRPRTVARGGGAREPAPSSAPNSAHVRSAIASPARPLTSVQRTAAAGLKRVAGGGAGVSPLVAPGVAHAFGSRVASPAPAARAIRVRGAAAGEEEKSRKAAAAVQAAALKNPRKQSLMAHSEPGGDDSDEEEEEGDENEAEAAVVPRAGGPLRTVTAQPKASAPTAGRPKRALALADR